MRRYTRTVAGALTATLNISGSVANLQAELTTDVLYPSERLGYNDQLGTDFVTLKTLLLNLIGAHGTIVMRTMPPDSLITAPVTYATVPQMIGLRTGNSDGGIYLNVLDGVSVRPNGVRYVPNGSAYAAGTTYTYNVSGRPTGTVRGLGWSNYGTELTGMTGGMFMRTTGLASLGAFSEARIGGDPVSSLNGIITHCVIYNRHLSYDEMSIMATMWQN